MDWFTIVLRIIHIGAGVFWAGSALLLVAYVNPAIEESGAEGAHVMRQMAGPGRLGLSLGIAALLSTVAGLLLYWSASGGLKWSWISSGPGIGFTVGGVAGVAAFVYSMIVTSPAAARYAKIREQYLAAPGRPDPDVGVEFVNLRSQVSNAGILSAVLLAIAVLAMSVARYLG
jgi:hypothetical protein